MTSHAEHLSIYLLAICMSSLEKCLSISFIHFLTTLCAFLLLSCLCSCLVIQSCLTLCIPLDSSLPGSSVLGIFLARILEWVAISYSRGSSQPRDWTCISWISCTGEWILYHCATWEAQKMRIISPYFIWLLWRLNEIVYAQELNELLQVNLCGTTPSVSVILR